MKRLCPTLLATIVAALILSMATTATAAPLGSRMHVVSITIGKSSVDLKTWGYYAIVTIADELGAPVPGAMVVGSWTTCTRRGGTLGATGVTDASGVAILGGPAIACSKSCTITFSVTDLSLTGLVYDAPSNVVSSASHTTVAGVCPPDFTPCNPRSKICHDWKRVVRSEISSERVFTSSSTPNPFIEHTVIQFRLPSAAHATVRVWSITGEALALLADSDLAEGDHSYVWAGTEFSGNRVAPGTYLYSIESGEIVETGTIILAR